MIGQALRQASPVELAVLRPTLEKRDADLVHSGVVKKKRNAVVVYSEWIVLQKYLLGHPYCNDCSLLRLTVEGKNCKIFAQPTKLEKWTSRVTQFKSG